MDEGEIAATILAASSGGTAPLLSDLDAKTRSAVGASGGIGRWADRLGLRRRREAWTDQKILDALRQVSTEGRMPSSLQVTASLNAAIVRRGGYSKWAEKAGLAINNLSTTRRGWAAERMVEAILVSAGYDVSRQERTKAPFDLLVDGTIRVNVKSATFREYGYCRGHFFGIGDTWRRCDTFAFVAFREDARHRVLWAASSEVEQQTVTLTRSHWLNQRESPLSMRDALASMRPGSSDG